jgi:hypothetical protein
MGTSALVVAGVVVAGVVVGVLGVLLDVLDEIVRGVLELQSGIETVVARLALGEDLEEIVTGLREADRTTS